MNCKHCGREIEGMGLSMNGKPDYWRHADTRARSCDTQSGKIVTAIPAVESALHREEDGR